MKISCFARTCELAFASGKGKRMPIFVLPRMRRYAKYHANSSLPTSNRKDFVIMCNSFRSLVVGEKIRRLLTQKNLLFSGNSHFGTNNSNSVNLKSPKIGSLIWFRLDLKIKILLFPVSMTEESIRIRYPIDIQSISWELSSLKSQVWNPSGDVVYWQTA